ncbi:BC_2427 family protein [Paenisporosarcina sp. OV554]|uniref:BC_2427 family protein n=1 Tax=Paenisporosarcina sp. OV554 TaxID=2135694 RepID=UPI000D364A3C|nr:hypothetical protein [Paenisporosarcina sp. OV554]PUB15132.1 hypothetical protein C8K15_10447 [Paenisporosarcina sp. OV554]
MTTPRINYEDMQGVNFKQKDVFTFSVAPDYQHKNQKDTIPWINYKDMQKMNYKEKDVYTFSVTSDFPHILEESAENREDICESSTKPGSFDIFEINDLSKTHKRKKRPKLRKKCRLRRRSREYRNDIYESDIKSCSVDTVEKENMGEISKRKKRSKFRKKCNLSRKNILFEANSISEDHTDITYDGHDDRYENAYADELNKHGGVRSRTIKIPFSTFEKIHNFLYPPIFSSTISATSPEHNLQINDVLKLEVASNFDVQMKQMSEQEASSEFESDHQLDAAFKSEIASRLEKHLPVEDIARRDASEDNVIKLNKNDANECHRYAGVRSMTIKIPISTFAEIDNFLHLPIFGSTIQDTFKFLDPNNKQIPKLDTKLIDTITYYHEQPYCLLIGFKSHEIIFLTDPDHVYRTNTKKKNDYYQSAVFPIHDSRSKKTRENKTCPSHESLNIRVPVVLGEYNIEICLEKDVLFEEKIYKVKEISKEVVLTNCKFVPAGFTHSTADEASKALNGKLFIEGYIYQNIEYFAVRNEDEKTKPKELKTLFHPLHQKIVVDLMVQLLQVQKVTM